jgi:formate/nitrite transporter FocA (FNT family)
MSDKYLNWWEFLQTVAGILFLLGCGVLVTQKIGNIEGGIVMSGLMFLLIRDENNQRRKKRG